MNSSVVIYGSQVKSTIAWYCDGLCVLPDSRKCELLERAIDFEIKPIEVRGYYGCSISEYVRLISGNNEVVADEVRYIIDKDRDVSVIIEWHNRVGE